MKMQDEIMKFSISGCNPNATNCGLSALSFGTIEAVLDSAPDAHIALLDFEKDPLTLHHYRGDTKHEIEYIDLRYSYKLFLRNNVFTLCFAAMVLRIMPLNPIKRFLYKLFPTLEKIAKIDRVLSIAGGDSFAELYGFGVLFYVAMPQILCIMMGKQIIQLPQTYGPFWTWPGRRLVHFILRNSVAIYSRDREGITYLKSLYPGDPLLARTHFSYDMGFLLESERPRWPEFEEVMQIRQNGAALAGFNISGLLYRSKSGGRKEFGLTVDYREIVSTVIKTLVQGLGYTVVLVPHVFGDLHENDLDAAADAFGDLRLAYAERVQYINKVFTCKEVKYLIGQCDFFCGSRMHACIGALSQYVPTVPLAYSRKFDGVMRTLELEWIVADLSQAASADALGAKVRDVHKKSDSIRQHLRMKMPEVKNTIRNIFRTQ
jgi:polysaccharide pyruvyl transferase WcaK-like protein